MKIRELHLRRYGHFTDRHLDFSKAGCNFHMICDDNEAGKTTSQNSIVDLLFGIPLQSPYAFMHEDRTSLSAVLENSQGQVRHFARNKARAGDLFDENTGQLLSPNDLLPFLGPLTKDILNSLFALNYQRLREGGSEIAKMQELGKILFVSSTTIPGLNALLEQIQKEEEDLYKKNGRNPKLNEAINKFKEVDSRYVKLRRQSKDDRLEKDIKQNEERYAAYEKQIEQLRVSIKKMERQAAIKPLMGQLEKVNERLQEIGELPNLPHADINRYWMNLQNEKAIYQQQLRESALKLESLSQQIVNLPWMPDETLLLEHDSEITRLWKETNYISDCQEECLGLKQKIHQVEAQIKYCLGELNLLDLPNPENLPKDSFLKEALALCQEGKNLLSNLSERQLEVANAEAKLKKAEKALQTLPELQDFNSLEIALERCHEAGNLEKVSHEIENDLILTKAALQKLQKTQHLWKGSIENLLEIPLPSANTLREYQKETKEIVDNIIRTETALKDLDKKMKGLELKIQSETKKYPTWHDLKLARQKRSQIWTDFKEALANNYLPPKQLLSDFEATMQEADLQADECFAHAQELAQREQIENQIKQLEIEQAFQTQNLNSLKELQQTLHHKWQEIWRPLTDTPLSPTEMSEWLETKDEMRDKHYHIDDLLLKKQNLHQTIAVHIRDLSKALIDLGNEKPQDDFRSLIEQGKKTLKALQTLTSEHRDKNAVLQISRENLEDALNKYHHTHSNLTKCQEDWQKALASLSQTTEINFEGGISLITTYQEMKQLHIRLQEHEKDLKAKKDRMNGFSQKVEQLSQHLKRSYVKGQEIHFLISLKKEWDKVQAKHIALTKATQEHQTEQERLTAFQKQLEVIELQKRDVFKQCQVTSDETMASFIAASEEANNLQKQKKEILHQIDTYHDGQPLEELPPLTIDEMKASVESWDDKLKDVLNQKEQLGIEIAKQRHLWQQGDPSAEIFEVAQQHEFLKTEIFKYTKEALLRRAGGLLLHKAVECHRQRTQGEQVRRAADLFRRLTCGRYINLIIEEEKGKQILKALRASGELKAPKEMSDGTCDQLYLALRLAALEEYAQRAEPMPFIADDLLVNFDDERSYAALEVLGEFSQQVQVIFFTHHPHLIKIAQKCLGSNFSLQRLSLPQFVV